MIDEQCSVVIGDDSEEYVGVVIVDDDACNPTSLTCTPLEYFVLGEGELC